MFKTFDEFLKEKGFTPESFQKEDESKRGDLVLEYNKYLREEMAKAVEAKASKEDLDAYKSELATLMADNQKTIIAKMKEMGLELQKINVGVENSTPKSFGAAVKEHHKDIVALIKGDKSSLVIKATTTTSSVANNARAFELPDIGQLAHRKLTAFDIFPKQDFPMNFNGTIRYIDWDDATKVRAADMIAEGGTFPESTAAWDTYTLKLKKVGDMIPWTDEFEYDDNFLMSELSMFLITNVDIKVDDQIVNGDNTGNNLKGMITSVPTYTPVASGITDASIYDLFVKLREAITEPYGSKYNPDFALMNINDINRYKLKKDANNNYVTPPFVSADGKVIDGVNVIECNAVPANQMYLGTRVFAAIYIADGINMEQGWINTDFREGVTRMRVYRRMAFLIREVNKTGFLRVTDISAALTTLAL